MAHAQQPIVSGVGMGSSAFPTLGAAKQLMVQRLQHLYGPIVSQTKAGPFAGSFNTVDIYTINFGGIGVQNILPTTKKIAVRTGKEASFALLPSGAYSPGGGPVAASHLRTAAYAQHTASALKEEALQSEKNWVFAHQHNLSPALYFYGYVASSANPPRLYLCAISEAFDSDLFDFYSDVYPTANGATQAGIDIMVRTQLTNLFNELARMGMLCFDIKPGNTVINYKEYILSKGVKPLTVKLIDWDADWCLSQKGLAKRLGLGAGKLREYYGLLMQIVMAIFFYGYFNNNIFADYFRKTLLTGNSRVDLNVYSSLGDLFCQSKEDIYFQHMASHYFSRAPIGIPYGGDCEVLWRGIYGRIFYKNRSAFVGARTNPMGDALSKYLFAGGLPAGASGGKRKHKKRRKRRNSKRHRRTRRKRLSMRRKTKRSRRRHRTRRYRRRRR